MSDLDQILFGIIKELESEERLEAVKVILQQNNDNIAQDFGKFGFSLCLGFDQTEYFKHSNFSNMLSCTALDLAVISNDLELVELLITYRDPNNNGYDPARAIYLAILFRHTDIIRYLLMLDLDLTKAMPGELITKEHPAKTALALAKKLNDKQVDAFVHLQQALELSKKLTPRIVNRDLITSVSKDTKSVLTHHPTTPDKENKLVVPEIAPTIFDVREKLTIACGFNADIVFRYLGKCLQQINANRKTEQDYPTLDVLTKMLFGFFNDPDYTDERLIKLNEDFQEHLLLHWLGYEPKDDGFFKPATNPKVESPEKAKFLKQVYGNNRPGKGFQEATQASLDEDLDEKKQDNNVKLPPQPALESLSQTSSLLNRSGSPIHTSSSSLNVSPKSSTTADSKKTSSAVQDSKQSDQESINFFEIFYQMDEKTQNHVLAEYNGFDPDKLEKSVTMMGKFFGIKDFRFFHVKPLSSSDEVIPEVEESRPTHTEQTSQNLLELQTLLRDTTTRFILVPHQTNLCRHGVMGLIDKVSSKYFVADPERNGNKGEQEAKKQADYLKMALDELERFKVELPPDPENQNQIPQAENDDEHCLIYVGMMFLGTMASQSKMQFPKSSISEVNVILNSLYTDAAKGNFPSHQYLKYYKGALMLAYQAALALALEPRNKTAPVLRAV